MKKKEIKVGDYWFVNYKANKKDGGYRGYVKVEDIDWLNDGWNCSCAHDWPCHKGWADFVAGDFIKPATKEEFLLQRLEFLKKEFFKAIDDWEKESEDTFEY